WARVRAERRGGASPANRRKRCTLACGSKSCQGKGVRRGPGGPVRAAAPPRLRRGAPSGLLDDVLLEARDPLQHLVLLLRPHLVLVEARDQMPDRGGPVPLADSEALVRGLHVAPGIDAR